MITWTTWIYFVQSAWEADRSLNKKYTYLPDAFPFLKSDKVVLNHYPDISRDARSNPSGFIVSMTTILLFCVLFREFEPASLWKLWSPSSGPLWPFTPCSRRDCSDWLKLAEANFLSFYLFIYFYCVKAKLTNETIMLQNVSDWSDWLIWWRSLICNIAVNKFHEPWPWKHNCLERWHWGDLPVIRVILP